MSALLSQGGSMAFEAARGTGTGLPGAAGVALFVFGALAFAAVAALLVASRASSRRCEADLDRADGGLHEEPGR